MNTDTSYVYDDAHHESDHDGWGDWEDVEEAAGEKWALVKALESAYDQADDETLNVGVHDRIYWDKDRGTFCYWDAAYGTTRKAF